MGSQIRAARPAEHCSRARVMVIGAAGPHATKVYLPALRETVLADLVATVELEAKREEALNLAGRVADGIEVVVTQPWVGDEMPARLKAELDNLVRRLGIDAVIIATEPLAHLSYLRWALAAGLHVLVDKPIVAFQNVSNEPEAAEHVLSAFESLVRLAERRPHQLVGVAVQRRYQVGFELARQLVAEVAERFKCPVTSIASTHADGQLRLPMEIETERYHGYNQGYGKLFHSGMHIVDFQAQVIGDAARRAGLRYNALQAFTSSVRPNGFIRQVPRVTYENHFGREQWANACPSNDAELRLRFREYGEMDLHSTGTFFSENDEVLVADIRLLHNSFSQRSWLHPRPDLYKGNGRVKHEHHEIVQSHFQKIAIHSYQSKDRHEINDRTQYGIGGNNHLEVHVFRNKGWWSPDSVPEFEIIDGAELAEQAGLSPERLLTNHAKTEMVNEFFECVTGRRPLTTYRSRLESHRLTSIMMAGISESMARRDLVTMPLHARDSDNERRAA